MNGLFIAYLVFYLLLGHFYLNLFCLSRIACGALGIADSDGLAPNIIVSIGVTSLILTVDGLLHEARTCRNPGQHKPLNWSVVIMNTVLTGAAVALAVTGALDIYDGHPHPDSLSHWKAGMGLVVAVWAILILWALFSLLPSQRQMDAEGYQEGTTFLQGAFIALALSCLRGVVLVFLPEVLAASIVAFVGVRTRNIRRGAKQKGIDMDRV
ncbi:hypothetical protein CNMCM8980_006112 [Aspergillus fumigatiaffinis]|nr:hypothetical protein CNMCM8980_006112 [Aspergillus fumigatiaffinis]